MLTNAHRVEVEVGVDGLASAPPSGAAIAAPPAGADTCVFVFVCLVLGCVCMRVWAPAGGAAAAAPGALAGPSASPHQPWWALETPYPCMALHGRGLRGPTARSARSAAVRKAMYRGLLKKQFLCTTAGTKISRSAPPICFFAVGY
jgi:hypothetical protein